MQPFLGGCAVHAWKASAAHVTKTASLAPPLLMVAGRDVLHHSLCRAALSNSTPLPTLRQRCRCVMLRPLPRESFDGGVDWGCECGTTGQSSCYRSSLCLEGALLVRNPDPPLGGGLALS